MAACAPARRVPAAHSANDSRQLQNKVWRDGLFVTTSLPPPPLCVEPIHIAVFVPAACYVQGGPPLCGASLWSAEEALAVHVYSHIMRDGQEAAAAEMLFLVAQPHDR